MNGSILVLDYVLMAENEETRYTFLADVGGKAVLAPQKQQFMDVPTDLWSYPAIEQMAAGGLVSGYGNGMFGPHDTITVAQFCQILARANGFETGAGETGWWAEKAVASCLTAGYVAERGKVLESNYSLPITREEAIAAMQLASGRPALPDKGYTLSEIPDAQDITVAYRDLIMAAYNSGITNGVDAQGTFLPQRTLTRGEICQLFYNLGWTEAKAGQD